MTPPALSHWLRTASDKNPDGIALEYSEIRLSYAALSLKVRQQADLLREAGLVPGDRIAIAATRSPDTVITILAAVEAGVAYVPLDLSYPADRLQAMLADAQPRVVVGEPGALSALQDLVGPMPSLDAVAPPQGVTYAASSDLTYVLFTSGSTGRPKGVAMGDLPLRHLIQWHAQHPRLRQAARTLQFAPLSFDVHFQEIFSTLACGGTLVLIPDSHRRDPALLREALQTQRVERIFLPYVALQMLAQADEDAHGEGKPPLALREVVSAGEQLQVTPTIRGLFERLPQAALHNHYGPTESHVVTAFELTGPPASWPGIPPIGTALPHVLLALRDPDTGTLSSSDTGELLLGGDTLAHGYLGQAQLSGERFLDGPAGLPGRWYATGDLVSRAPDGVLTYQGRIDQQLKVDGFRIEPGDIELALMAHESIQDAAVTAPNVPGSGRQLVAHVVLRPGSPALAQLLAPWRQWLRDRLPDYMIPVRFIALDKLPTTPSGKIDRRSLPLPAVEASSTIDPHTLSVAERLRSVWQELLGLNDLADDSNVFDAGARSLLVMRFVSRVKQLGLNLSVAEVYDRPTIAGMAQSLQGAAAPTRRHVPTGPQDHDGIAIIGMSVRADNAHDLDTFWANLLADRESIRRFAPHEVDPSVPEDVRNRPNFVAARGVLEDADRFDAAFFGISAREATVLDPQQRLFLELCWSALENAAIDPSRGPDRIGVYAGSANNTYLPAMRAEQPDLIQRYGEFATMLASEKDYVATRAANRLNLRGPAVSIHTACSTSLVAITQAWHALAQGQCDVALAGGVTVVVPQPGGYLYVEGSMESSDGRCRPFDADASGTVFASGGGVVVLKRLKQALADGDTVYAVIKGVGINNDGGDKASFTAPSVSGQAEAIAMALDHAGINARSIGYVEAHGTGTSLGDPIEIAALSRAWSRDTSDKQFCQIGSIKGHLGHTVAAAGVLGLIKATLSMHREVIPGTLHYRRPNPQIDLANTPFTVQAEARAWPRGPIVRRAAVSSFGVGGTNAHVVLEESPQPASLGQADQLSLLPLSAKTAEAVLQRARDLADHLERHPHTSLHDAMATLSRGRQRMGHRVAVVARSGAEAVASLRQVKAAQAALVKPRVLFLFPGQGSQHPGMARQLYDEMPAFREAFDRCLAAAPEALAMDLRQWLVQALPTDAEAAAKLAETRHAQPALFCVLHALTAWLDSLGIRPDAMIGHSIGEYAAACHAGVLSVDHAMNAVIARGQAMFDQPAGAMLAVRASADLVRSLMPSGVEIAAANAPTLTVVGGPFDTIAAFATRLEAQDIGTTRLKVSHAFHSVSMDGALPRVAQALGHATLNAPSIPMYSCVSGALLQDNEATDPQYWARQVRATVQFSRAVQAELDQGDATVFVEVGPGQALTALLRQHRTAQNAVPRIVPLLGSAQDPGEPAVRALQGLGALWCAGVELAWPVPANARRIALPAYPFRGESHWFVRKPTAVVAPVSLIQEDARPMSRLPRLEQELTRIFSDISGMSASDLDRDTTFVNLDLDSLSLTQATLELERVFGIKLRFRRLMEDLDTLAKLVQFLDAELPTDKFVPPPVSAVAAQPAPMATAVFTAHQPSVAGDAVHQLIQQQMQLMAQQLALLSGQSAAPANVVAAPASAPFTPVAPQAAATAELGQPSKTSLLEKPFGASARITLQAQTDFTPTQMQWVTDFIQRYNQRTGQSKSFSQKNRKAMADPRVVTGFNPLWKDLVYPIVVNRSKGANLWDLDGNEYIDLLSCFGGNLLGYQPESVIAAISEQLQLGLEVGPQHPLAAEVANLISEFTGMERVGFCNTGSEAVMGAMRIARTVTGRKTIAIFTNSYHGIFDEVIVRGTKQLRSLSAAPGILANSVENILVLDWNSEDSLRVLRERGPELAAIMTEPIQNKYPTVQPREFVKSLREIADQVGCALIFDEVVTGFRVAPGGAQEFYGVRADIATYGKVIGGGLPFAAIAGNANWLDALDGGHWQYGDDSYPEAGVTYFAGTFVRHPLALAAAHATLLHLKRGGREFYRELNGRTQRLIDRLNAAFAQRGAPVKAVHCASLWRLQWDDGVPNISLFYYLARFHGLHLYEQFGHFVTEAMTDAHTDRIVEVFTKALEELIALGFIPSRDGSAAEVDTALLEAPLTPGQTERWLAAIYDPAARRALNESFCVTLTGQVDASALKAALQDVLQRHTAFKLRFDLDEPRQIIEPQAVVPMAEVDLRAQADSDQALDQHCRQANEVDLPLDRAPLARASIIHLADGRVVVHVVASHLIFDGWASSVFNVELAQAYRARASGLTPAWASEPGSPLAFAVGEQKRFNGADGQASIAHWKQVLQALPLPVSLGDKTPTGPRTFAADTVRARLDGTKLATLREQAKAQGATLFQWLLNGVAELIAQESGQRDIVVSIPYAAQSLERHAPLLADGVLDLPVRLTLPADEPFKARMARVKSALMDAMEHPLMTQGIAARALGLQAEGSHPPLSSIYFNLNPKVDLSGWAPLKAQMHEGRKAGLLSELFFNFYEQADALTLDLHHSSEYLSLGRAQQLVDQLIALLSSGSTTVPVQLDPRLLDWNRTDRALDPQARIEAWVSRQAKLTPNATAVINAEGHLTYSALESQSNQIARVLQARGAGPGQRVGISLPRSTHLLPALIGVLKTGAAYVPMDPGFPTERLKMMAEDASLGLVVTHSSCADASGLPRATQLRLDDDAAIVAAASDTSLPALTDTQAAAYVIYTSGSTGRPKGVAVQHSAVCNFLSSMQREPGFKAGDRLLAVTTLSFDIAVLELLLPLSTGGTVVLATRDEAMDGETLMALITQHQVTVMQATPTTWHLLLDAGWQPPRGLRALVGGEPLPPALATALLAKGIEVWNMYGPTETTVWSTLSPVRDPNAKITIGRPIDNTQVWILNEAMQPVTVGQEGEICIGGDGVALGYHGRPDLTSDRFVTLPWGPRPAQRIYRTGDLGRWREDGQLEHLGRMDFQVKIRGYRIELGEIEAQLEAQSGVARAVVTATEISPGDMALIGYVVPQGNAALDSAALRASLRQTLPDYMVPRTILVLPKLPLLPNNKIDRKALPLPASMGSAPVVQAATAAPAQVMASGPLADATNTVAQEMGKLLGRDRLQDHDHFFEQGGHSLMAAKLSAALASALGHRPGLRMIFDHPTPAKLAQALVALKQAQPASTPTSGAGADTIPIRADQSTAPLSQMQERVWFLENVNPGTVVHSIPTGHRLLGPLNVEAFNRAWQLLVQRQSVLRTVVERTPEGDVQRILPSLDFCLLPFDDFSHLPEAERKPAMNKVIAELVETPYDVEKGPLFTARLFRLAPEEHGLLFQAHHLVWDAWSFDLLYVDLPELYSACLEAREPNLPKLTVSYGDFAAWHKDWMSGPELKRQLDYWREQLTPLPPSIELPLDRPRPPFMSGRGGSFQFNLAKDVTDALRTQAQQQGRTLYITLLAAYALALHRVSQQDDFVIGTPVRGREQPALEPLMGFFVNMLPLRMQLQAGMSLSNWLASVHRKVVDAFSFPDVPFDHLVQALQVPRDLSRPPIHQVSFSYQDVRERTTRWGNVDHQRMPTPMLGAAQDLALWCVETRNHIEFVFTFNADVLDTATVGVFAASLEKLLRQVVTDPDRPLSDYDLSPGEQKAPAAPPATLPDLLRQRTHAASNNVALSQTGERPLSHAELWSQANQVSHFLRAQGIGRGQFVGVCLPRRPDLLAALLGILQAGAACVVLDPRDTSEQLASTIQDTGLSWVIGRSDSVQALSWPRDKTLLIDLDERRLRSQASTPSAPNASLDATATDPACLISSAGSTGQARHMAWSHRQVIDLLLGLEQKLGLRPGQRQLAANALGSGMSIVDFYLPLLVGAEVVLSTEEATRNTGLLKQQLGDEIDAMQATPATWQALVDAAWTGHDGFVALCAGEPLPASLASQLLARRLVVHHTGDLEHLGQPAAASASASVAPASSKPAPSTPMEKAIAEVWQELIGENDIGLDDNFFDLGGHSLLAMRAVTEIRRRTGVNVSVRRLIFETLGQLAAPQTATPLATAQATGDLASPVITDELPSGKSSWINRLLGR